MKVKFLCLNFTHDTDHDRNFHNARCWKKSICIKTGNPVFLQIMNKYSHCSMKTFYQFIYLFLEILICFLRLRAINNEEATGRQIIFSSGNF